LGIVRGVKRDFAALERRRMTAVSLLRKGLNQSEVARQLMVRHQSVSRWVKTAAAEGDKGLKAKGRPGPKPLMDEEHRRLLAARLHEGQQRQTPPWTGDRVADLIEREFGIRYHPNHVAKILRQLSWRPQQPAVRRRSVSGRFLGGALDMVVSQSDDDTLTDRARI
jgi:transposase